LCFVGMIQYMGNIAMMFLAEPYDALLGDLFPTTAERMADMSRMLETDTWGELMAVLVLAAVTPAVCEEHFFRGVIQSSLDKRMPGTAAVVVVAVVFAAYHLEPVGFSALLMIGRVVGVLTTRSGCILYACAIHFINNALSVLLQTWTTKNVGVEVGPDAGSFDSLPIYLIGAAVGVAAFLARTPRRHRRRWHDGPRPDDPPVYRPGTWHRASVWLADRWRLAAVLAVCCSVWGAALDVRDLREIAAASKASPVDEADEVEPRDKPSGPDEMMEERDTPEPRHVDAGVRDGYSPTVIRATLHRFVEAPGPSTIAKPFAAPDTRRPKNTSYAPGLVR